MDEEGKKYEFLWRIENFNSKLPTIGNEVIDSKCLISPNFYFYLSGNTEWCLEVYPRTGPNRAFLKVLPVCRMYDKNCQVSIEISVLTNQGLVHSSKKVRGSCSGVFHSDFANAIELERSKLPLQTELILRCVLLDQEKDQYEGILYDSEKLSQDLYRTYENQLFSDLTLTVGSHKLPANRALLCIRAPKLAEKLDIQDAKTCKLVKKIQNISLPVLKMLLLYFYTGQLNESVDDSLLPELCDVIKQYKLVHLEAEFLPISVHSVCRTRVKTFTDILHWQISNFSHVKSSISRIIEMELGVFLISLTPSASNNSEISFTILSFSKGPTVYFRCKLCLVDKAGDLTYFSDHEHCFEKDYSANSNRETLKDKWIFPTSLKHSDMSLDKDKYLPGDQLTLKMEFETTEGEKLNDVLETTRLLKKQFKKITHSNSLSNDFLNIFSVKNRPDIKGGYYDGDCYNDVILKVGEDKVYCHKFILGARSPVFAEIFHSDPNVKEIAMDDSDIDYDTLLTFGQYLYSGTTGRARLAAMEQVKLYVAAEKYQINSLSQKCLALLEKTLSGYNVYDVIAFANMRSDKLLSDIVYKFIKSNREVLEIVREDPAIVDKITSRENRARCICL